MTGNMRRIPVISEQSFNPGHTALYGFELQNVNQYYEKSQQIAQGVGAQNMKNVSFAGKCWRMK